jgi:predicted nucleotidyltransferase
VVREELGTIDHIEQLFIFGSWAAHYADEQGPAPHDVDVLIIGHPTATRFTRPLVEIPL